MLQEEHFACTKQCILLYYYEGFISSGFMAIFGLTHSFWNHWIFFQLGLNTKLTYPLSRALACMEWIKSLYSTNATGVVPLLRSIFNRRNDGNLKKNRSINVITRVVVFEGVIIGCKKICLSYGTNLYLLIT